MFLSNDDFYQLRRITLSDLLDSQSCFRLTHKIISSCKRELLKTLRPDIGVKKSKKRKRASADDEENYCENVENLIDVFDQEEHLESYYNNDGYIRIDEIPELGRGSMYLAIDTKDLTNMLDLKKEVVMTMLNQLEQVEGSFFRVDSILPASLGMRFHKKPIEVLAEESKIFKAIFSLSPKSTQGVFRFQTVKLAEATGLKPYNIPRILYQIQMQGEAGISYETDHESFILQVH